MQQSVVKCGDEYELRYAAGIYWLVDVGQPGIPYQKPLMLNETGAEIFQEYFKEKNVEKVAYVLSKKYKIAENVLIEDMKQFVEQLQSQGVVI